MIEIVLKARHPNVADLVEACARGQIPFSGPDGLTRLVAEMGFATDSLYPMVCYAKSQMEDANDDTQPVEKDAVVAPNVR